MSGADLATLLKRAELIDRVQETARAMNDRIRKAAQETDLDLQALSDQSCSDA